MLYNIALVLLAVFAVIGVVEVIKSIHITILKDSGIKGKLVIPLKGDIEDVEYKLRSICANARWNQDCTYSKIIIVDEGMSAHTKAICAMLCDDFEEIKMG